MLTGKRILTETQGSIGILKNTMWWGVTGPPSPLIRKGPFLSNPAETVARKGSEAKGDCVGWADKYCGNCDLGDIPFSTRSPNNRITRAPCRFRLREGCVLFWICAQFEPRTAVRGMTNFPPIFSHRFSAPPISNQFVFLPKMVWGTCVRAASGPGPREDERAVRDERDPRRGPSQGAVEGIRLPRRCGASGNIVAF